MVDRRAALREAARGPHAQHQVRPPERRHRRVRRDRGGRGPHVVLPVPAVAPRPDHVQLQPRLQGLRAGVAAPRHERRAAQEPWRYYTLQAEALHDRQRLLLHGDDEQHAADGRGAVHRCAWRRRCARGVSTRGVVDEQEVSRRRPGRSSRLRKSGRISSFLLNKMHCWRCVMSHFSEACCLARR